MVETDAKESFKVKIEDGELVISGTKSIVRTGRGEIELVSVSNKLEVSSMKTRAVVDITSDGEIKISDTELVLCVAKGCRSAL